MGNLKTILFIGYTYKTNIVNVKKSSNIIGFKIILKIYIRFTGFINGVIIFISIFLFILFYLRLIKNYLLFILKDILKNNKINYNNNTKIKMATKW